MWRRLVVCTTLSLLLANSPPSKPSTNVSEPSLTGPGQIALKSEGQASSSPRDPILVRIVQSPDETAEAAARERLAQRHDKDELLVQKLAAKAAVEQARFALPTLIVGGLGTLFVCAALVLTVCANRTAARAVADARAREAKEIRPWVFVSGIRINGASPDGRLYGEILFKNYGNWPAENFIKVIEIFGDSYPFWARALPSIDDGASTNIAPTATESVSMEDVPDCVGPDIKTRVSIRWSYKLADGSDFSGYDAFVMESDQEGKPYFRKFIATDSFNHPKYQQS